MSSERDLLSSSVACFVAAVVVVSSRVQWCPGADVLLEKKNNNRRPAMNRPRYDVPPELTNLLLEFTVNVMIERPSDLVEYAARYFSGLRDERQRSASSGRPPAIAENDEAIYSDDEEPMPSECRFRRGPTPPLSGSPPALGLTGRRLPRKQRPGPDPEIQQRGAPTSLGFGLPLVSLPARAASSASA